VAAKRRAQQPRARAAVISLPNVPRVPRVVPSRRSALVGIGLLAVATGAYFAARQSSAFAVTNVEIAGAPPKVRAQVRQTLSPLAGTSLLALDGGALVRHVEALPTVVSAGYDRAFPHTLRVTVVPEVPVALLRRGHEAWILSARGRVVAPIRHPERVRGLPRIWVPAKTQVAVGAIVPDEAGGAAARALAVAARFPAHITAASWRRGELVFHLRSGLDLRLGAPSDIWLKLAIARQALPRLPSGATYLDVSVPERPVAPTDNPQVSTGG
jgi:cell division protein FtsQ